MNDHKISDKTFAFLQAAFVDAVKEFLDDPDGMVGGEGDTSLQAMLLLYEELVSVGEECELKFWVIAEEECTEYEINRLKEFLKKAMATKLAKDWLKNPEKLEALSRSLTEESIPWPINEKN